MSRCLLIAFSALACLATPAAAQFTRNFPSDALRGEITFGNPPQITLNGKPTSLAPGARIRAQSNMIEMSGAVVGQKHAVHYTLDMLGQPKDIWLLRPQELARKPWPVTAQQARDWQFDPAAQTWTQP